MVTLTMNVAPFVWILSVFQVKYVETESGQSPSKAKSRQRSGVERRIIGRAENDGIVSDLSEAADSADIYTNNQALEV